MNHDTKKDKCESCLHRPQPKKNSCAYCKNYINHNEYDQKTYGNCCKKCNNGFVKRVRITAKLHALRYEGGQEKMIKDLEYQYEEVGKVILGRRIYNEYRQKSIDLSEYLAKMELLKE